MNGPDDRISLEPLLGEDDLETRAARVAVSVGGRLDESDPLLEERTGLASVLTHPALAAAAVVGCVLVRLTVGGAPADSSADPAGGNPGTPTTIDETSLAEMLPLWLREE